MCIVLFTLYFVHAYAQQDAQYSQYMFNHLAINPAYAGSRDAFSTALVYRNQWTNIKGAPSTAAFSAQLPLKQQKIGLGTEIFSDKLGPWSASAFLFSYAYRVPFSTGKLSFGLRMGIVDYVYDWTKLDFKDQGDVFNIQSSSSKITGTADFGLRYYSRTFYFGLSGTHMTHSKMSDLTGDSTRQARHYFITIGKSYKIGNTILNPTLLIKSAQNAPATTDLGINVLLKEKWWIGMSFRSSYGIVFLSQYNINENLRVGYSYDVGVNGIGTAGGGSHEIMIGYDLNIMGSKVSMPRYL
jgi:type IX secretion system PorP/SprF family membrane protein